MSRVRAIVAASTLFVLLAGVGLGLVLQSERVRATAEREAAVHAGAGTALGLERQLSRSLSAAYALAAILRHEGRVDAFDALAAEMLPIYGGISSLQLAPGGVIRRIHPAAGNQAALGMDLLRDPARRADAHAAIRSRQLTLSGPHPLVQGGVGVVGRLAVFVPDEAAQSGERFWGFVVVIVRLDDLIGAAQVERLADRYGFRLSRRDRETGALDAPFFTTGAPLRDPVSFPVKVPGGEWQLDLAPTRGWARNPWLGVAVGATLLASAGLALLGYAVLRQPARLRREVEARTAELARAHQRLAADAEERRRTEAALLQVQKMEAVGQLAGGVAHDFNNLLTGIIAHADLLAESAPPGTDGHESAKVIGEAALRAAELTRQLLGFARRGKLVVAPFDAHAVLREASRLLARTLDKSIQVVERLEAGSSTILGDPGQLQQAIVNLAVNARDAMPGGGVLTFATSLVDLDAAGCEAHPGTSPGPHLAVAVRDTGHGIPREDHARVFEPFFTTKDPGRGTGMGLAMVYGIARNHGGVVELESAPGQGATFTLLLPLAPPELRAATEVPREAVRGASGRVLVVDDDAVPRDAAARLLRRAGYHVTTVASGAEAVRWYADNRARCDVVLLDLAMPDMDGGSCFRALRAIDPTVRVVLTSGYGRNGRAQELLDAGVVAFATKPYDAASLGEVVARAAGARA